MGDGSSAVSTGDDPPPVPPPGYGYMSVPIDSGCSVHIVNDNRWFKWLRPANISIKTASNVTEVARREGAALLHCYTDSGHHAPILFHDAAHAPQMHNLVSVSKLLDVGVRVQLAGKGSHLLFPDGIKVPLGRSKGLFLMDFVVPLESVSEESRTVPLAALATELDEGMRVSHGSGGIS